MNKYSKLLIALFLFQGIVLTGCGGSDDEDDNGGDVSADWTLVWEDEFEGDAIDTTKWSHEINCDGGGNNELQCYTDSSNNSFVEDGMLHIVASDVDAEGAVGYTSARLRTLDKGDWKYGRIEVNAKMPEGQGLWPAIWMLPSEWVYGSWPLSGEIDIFEAVNPSGTGGNTTYGTIHYGQSWPNNLNTGESFEPATNIWQEFHTYAIEWEEGEIRWYVDDTHFATQTSDGWFSYYYCGDATACGDEVGFQLSEGAAPFDQKFHLLLNLAIGGNFPFGQAGTDEVTSIFPQEMVVDYVRVYECSADAETGVGCASNVDPDIEPLTGSNPTQNVISLYEDGPSTLELAEGVSNTLVPGLYNPSGAVVSDEAFDDGGNTVWDINFGGAGNVQLNSADMTGVEGVENGIKLTNMTETGELKFDLKVLAIDETTELLVKLDSGWPNVSYKSIVIPEANVWTTVSVKFSDLAANNVEPGEVNYSEIIAPFVLEVSGGTAHVQVDNIQITCLSECGVDPVYSAVSGVLVDSFDVIIDAAAGPNWDVGIQKWDNSSNSVVITTVADAERGDVTNVSFSGAVSGLMYVQSSSPKDLSAFVGNDSYITFDIKVLSYGSNTTGLVVKMENAAGAGAPPGTGDLVVTPNPPVGTWTTVQVPIDDMINHTGTSGSFNINAVVTPFAFFPVWDDQTGVEFQLDNVRWILGEGTGGDGGSGSGTVVGTEEIFIDAVDADWASPGASVYVQDGQTVTNTVVADSDPEHGNVLQTEFGTTGFGTMYIQSSTPKDLQAYSGGDLIFDLKVVEAGSNTGGFKVKADCVYPCGSAEVPVAMPAEGTWTTITVDIPNLSGLNLSTVDTPISFFPVSGQQAGVIFQLDNIRWVRYE